MAKASGQDSGELVDPRRLDPLAATPVVAPDVEALKDNAMQLQLRRPVPPRTVFGRTVQKVFGYTRKVRVNLDERGTEFWEQIDGARDLHEIERLLRQRYGLKVEESRRATIEFTKTLMTRGLICLRLPGQDGSEGEGSDG